MQILELNHTNKFTNETLGCEHSNIGSYEIKWLQFCTMVLRCSANVILESVNIY